MKNAKKGSANNIFYLLLALVAVGGIAALTVLSTRPRQQQVSEIDPNLPPVQSEGYVLGSPTAPVEVIEFADFECPVCSQFAAITEPDIRERLVKTGQVRLRFVDFPLPMHRNTWNASRAAACADEQGQFWEMHDLLFQTQDQWNGEATSNPDKFFKELATRLSPIDTKKFDECIDTKRTQAKIQAHHKISEERQVSATPSFVIGGQLITGSIGYDEFKRRVDEAKAKAVASAPAAPAGAAAPKSDSAKGGATRR